MKKEKRILGIRLWVLFSVFFICIISLICIAPFAFFWGLLTLSEIRTEQRFHVYNDADKLFVARAQYGGSSDIKKIWYLTEDSFPEVQAYYETFFPTFRMWNEQEHYQYTAFMTDGSDLDSETIENGYWCRYKQQYKCVNVFLVDLSQYPARDVPIANPETMGLSPDHDAMIRDELAALPSVGTLIVYKYFTNHP